VVVVQAVGGQIIKPIVGMLGFSLAFAIPFTLLAYFPSWLEKLPKSGGWLNTVKVVIGFIELAFAIKFLSVPDLTYHWGI
jgi:thiol:disulfide interchange protein